MVYLFEGYLKGVIERIILVKYRFLQRVGKDKGQIHHNKWDTIEFQKRSLTRNLYACNVSKLTWKIWVSWLYKLLLQFMVQLLSWLNLGQKPRAEIIINGIQLSFRNAL